MLYSNLDTIVRRQLLELGLPIHFYSELLFHCATAIRELSFDSLKIINAARLPTNHYAAADLPGDFQDDIAVCIPVGGAMYPLPKQDWINPISVHNAETGAFEAYTNSTDENSETFFGMPGVWNWYWNFNDYGEPTGRFFGNPGGTQQGYKIIPNRRQIQLTENFVNSNIVLLYISDGQQADNATNVDTAAISTIHAYSNWKRSPRAAMKDSPEGATYYNERRLLRARKNPLTKTDIINVLRNGYSASIKT